MRYKPLAIALLRDNDQLRGSIRLAVTTLNRINTGEAVEPEKVIGLLKTNRAAASAFAEDARKVLLPKKREK